MKKLLVVSDWVNDALTCQEVKTVVEGFLENPLSSNISFVSSTPSTIHTGFLISQLVETEERYGRPLDTVIFQAADPAVDNAGESAKIWGELLIIRLKSGMHIIGPNAGYVFSLIKSKIDVVFQYPGLSISGSFRARDVFARIVAHLMDSKQDDLNLEEGHTNLIPQTEEYYVAHIDNFGNIITTIPESAIQEKSTYGNEINITINNVTKTVLYTKSLFEEDEDTLVIYPGTTGNPDDPYLEVSKYVDLAITTSNALQDFNNPKPGNKIQIV
jgi:hypothetical protein